MAKTKKEKPEEKEEEKEEKETPEKPEKDAPPSEDKFSVLKKELSELKEAQAKQEQFLQGANIVIRTIAGDPDLTKSFQDKLKQSQGQQPQQQQQQQQQQQPQRQMDKRIAGVEASQREKVVRDFEKEYGITNLKDTEKKEARKKIANYLSDFGWSINTVPLQNLSKTLDKAYVGTHAEKLREEGKLEGFTQARQVASASMPTLGGGVPAKGETEELSSKQKEWTKKLGVSEEKASKAYLGMDEEKTRVPPAEKKK